MKKLVVLTGAGMSAESGISTFRDSGGLWEQHRVEDVATPEGWIRNPKLVLDFYNERRRQLKDCQPNAGHTGLAELEKDFEVHIITQNIDNLHERAGSSHVIHLHGELTKACDEHKSVVKEIGYNDIQIGDKLGKTQMRPFIVWFGEAVPAIEEAIEATRAADIFAVVGTSLKVYPAAGLLNYVSSGTPIYLIDPKEVDSYKSVHFIQKGASEGIKDLKEILLKGNH
jgi:NAD-dependent deacetylase